MTLNELKTVKGKVYDVQFCHNEFVELMDKDNGAMTDSLKNIKIPVGDLSELEMSLGVLMATIILSSFIIISSFYL